MLNPVSNNFVIEFGNKFYDENMIKKYNDFLIHKNNPIKNIKGHIHESIESLSIPGLNLSVNEVDGLKNFNSTKDNHAKTTKWVFPKNQPLIETFEINKLNIVCKNTIINWSYFYEFFRKSLVAKKLDLTNFSIDVIIRDAGDIPILMFQFKNCFSASLPPLDFSYGSTFGESKTIDVGFWFNEMDVMLLMPDYSKTNLFWN